MFKIKYNEVIGNVVSERKRHAYPSQISNLKNRGSSNRSTKNSGGTGPNNSINKGGPISNPNSANLSTQKSKFSGNINSAAAGSALKKS